MEQGGMRRFLLLALILLPIPTSGADNPRTTSTDLTPPAEIVRAVDTVIAEMIRPGGPAAPNWEKQGVDMIARIAAAPGGMDGTVTISDAPGDRAVDHYGRGSVALPEGLKPLTDLPGKAMKGEIRWESVSELEGGLWMRTTARLTPRGNALCGQGWETLTILAPADAPLSEEARVGVMVVRLMAERMAAMEMCMIAFEQPDGSLHERSFLPDGRPLPKLDEEMKPIRIRPLADAAAILKP